MPSPLRLADHPERLRVQLPPVFDDGEPQHPLVITPPRHLERFPRLVPQARRPRSAPGAWPAPGSRLHLDPFQAHRFHPHGQNPLHRLPRVQLQRFGSHSRVADQLRHQPEPTRLRRAQRETPVRIAEHPPVALAGLVLQHHERPIQRPQGALLHHAPHRRLSRQRPRGRQQRRQQRADPGGVASSGLHHSLSWVGIANGPAGHAPRTAVGCGGGTLVMPCHYTVRNRALATAWAVEPRLKARPPAGSFTAMHGATTV